MRVKPRGRRVPALASWKDPQAWGVCDGCALWTMRDALKKDMQYRGGDVPVWTGFLVCGKCQDVPQPYYQRQVLPPDPVPVQQPRPGVEPWQMNYLATQDGVDGALLMIDESYFLGIAMTPVPADG